MDYSLSIGIDEYSDVLLINTPYAENDALTYKDTMNEQFELEDNILLVGQEATKENIIAQLDKIVSKIQENDRLFFYFAGHGSNVYNEPRLACYNSQNNAKKDIFTWYDLNDVMGKIAEKKANLICFIDACGSTVNYSPRGNVQGNDTDSKYIYVFSAANYGENANSDKNLEHGIWTYFLLEALNGAKEALENNKLTNNSLQNFLNEQVTDYYSKKGEVPCQIPQSWGKTSREFVIKEFTHTCAGENKEMYIKDIYFGTVDADNEIKEEPNKFVSNYFDLNNVSKDLVNKDNVQFVIGRKGTGKTYTGMYLQKVSGGKVKYLAMDSFDYKALNFLAQNGNGYEQYVWPWKYFILSQFLLHINTIIKNEEIDDVLLELYGRRATTQQILHRKFKRGIQFGNDSISQKWMKELAKTDNYFSLQEIAQIFSFLIEDNINHDYILILDGLDEKINENKNYQEMMNGLIWAVKNVNAEMYENKVGIKVAIFFRKDVFEFVQGANTAKIAVGSTVNLDWVSDSDDKKKYPLYQFMNIRYLNCLKDHGIEVRNQELIDILPEYVKVGNERINTWDWILNFTTYKPRDVVKLLSECGKKSVKDEKQITQEILWEAQPEYSKYIVKELKNELYGFIDDKLINAIFDMLQSMHKGWKDYQFVKGIIARSSKRIGLQLNTEQINYTINKLYEAGVFGVQLPNEHEQWYYRKYMKINDYIEKSKYKLHQGLWKELSIW